MGYFLNGKRKIFAHLLDDVLEGIFEPVIEGDVALAVLIYSCKVLLALGNAGLEYITPTK